MDKYTEESGIFIKSYAEIENPQELLSIESDSDNSDDGNNYIKATIKLFQKVYFIFHMQEKLVSLTKNPIF